jgi:hypothetical protein
MGQPTEVRASVSALVPSVLLTVLDKESKISDLPTVFLDAVTKSIGKSG